MAGGRSSGCELKSKRLRPEMSRGRAIRMLFWQKGREGWEQFHLARGWLVIPAYPKDRP